MKSVEKIYLQEIATRGFTSDPAQLHAVAALDRCAREWKDYKAKRATSFKKLFNHPPIPKGVYMYGGVGRGKSFLMDCFYEAVPIQRKTRLHFHEFMREVHRELGKLQGQQNPLRELGSQMAKRFKLICFDEFHISDVTDAMILHRLLESLFSNGVGFVTTSNFKPDALYPNGLHRDRILPAIDLLNEQLEVINVDHGVDYRLQSQEQLPLYITPLGPDADRMMEKAFAQIAGADAQPSTRPVQIGSREIAVIRRADEVAWFDFRELCDKPLSQNDYLELTSMFQTIMVSGVPKIQASMASMARRFTLLVDVLYDRHVKLVVSAATPPEQLYTEGLLAHEFVRTVSRLQEMQSAEYQTLERRDVDISIT
ncbi:MAG: cell division protein ZapE [Brachymonas sp.]|nr:cell division protein ZapE [Brachymonas sp.]